MARSSVITNQYDTGSIVIVDGTASTPLELTLLFDQADFSVAGLSAEMTEVVAYEIRRVLVSLRRTSRSNPTGSFSLMLSELSESSAGTLMDFIAGTSGTPFAARVSTTAAKGDVATFNITFNVDGDGEEYVDSSLTLGDCRLTFDIAQGDPNTVTFNFTMYGDVSGDLTLAA